VLHVKFLGCDNSVVAVQSLTCVCLFATPLTAARLSFTVSWSLLKFMSTESEMLSNHLILCHPLLLLPSIFLSCCRCQVISVVSDSVRPHRQQPTRLPRPWDSPGKNTGVGCHFLLQCMKVKSESEVAQSCLTPSDPMDCSLPVSPGKSTGVGCHCLLQRESVSSPNS